MALMFKDSENEAQRSISVSLSYYGLFNFIVGSLVSKGVLFPENSDDLGRVVAHLKKSNNNTIGGVGGTLKSLRLLRNKADHTMDAVFATGISQFAYEKSRIALTQFESLPSAQMEAVVRTIQAIP